MPAYSGLFDGHHGTPHALLTNKTGNAETMLARLFAGRGYDRAKLRELMIELTGAAAGQAALVQRKRVQAEANLSQNVQGGLRTIETFDVVNRVTASADETNIEAALALSSQPSSYPADASGNGGGGKLGY